MYGFKLIKSCLEAVHEGNEGLIAAHYIFEHPVLLFVHLFKLLDTIVVFGFGCLAGLGKSVDLGGLAGIKLYVDLH